MSNFWLKTNKLTLKFNYELSNSLYHVDYTILNIWKERPNGIWISDYIYITDGNKEISLAEGLHLKIQEAFANGNKELYL